MGLLYFYINKKYYCKLSYSTGSKTTFHINVRNLKKRQETQSKALDQLQPYLGQWLLSDHFGQLVYNKHDVKEWSYSPNPNILLAKFEGGFMNAEWGSFEKFQYWPSHFLWHISTQQNTSNNCQKCHKIDISMKICLHTSQICFYKCRLTFLCP